MKHNLTLVTLAPDQILRAKEANGERKRITHALICGPYGQLFGTEKQCLKYFTAWDPAYRIEVAPRKFKSIFPGLFDKAVKTDKFEITEFEITWNLTEKLFEASDALQLNLKPAGTPAPRIKVEIQSSDSKKHRGGFFRRLFSHWIKFGVH